MHVRVMDRYGRTVTVCELPELYRMLEGLVSKHDRVLVEQCLAPKTKPLLPEDFPFSTPPTVCAVSAEEGEEGKYRVTLDIPVHVREGGIQNLLVEVVSTPEPDKFGRALRREIHRVLPMTDRSIANFKDWYEQVVVDLISSAIDDAQQGDDL